MLVNSCLWDEIMKKEPQSKKWIQNVKTVSTYPPIDLFTQDADTIARVMASKEVSPKGVDSGVRMIQFFINRAGKNLPPHQKEELEKAKRILQEERALGCRRLRGVRSGFTRAGGR